MTGLSIGSLAAETGVSVSALRYYESRGLVAPTGRVGGKRRFSEAAIVRVRFVRHAQEVGFTLDEIRALLDGSGEPWRSAVAAKRADLLTRRDRIDAMIADLDAVASCACSRVAACDRMAAFGSTRPKDEGQHRPRSGGT